MTQRVRFTLNGATAETTCDDRDAAIIVDVLRVAWQDDSHRMITVSDSNPTGGPMHINTRAVQAVQLTEVAS